MSESNQQDLPMSKDASQQTTPSVKINFPELYSKIESNWEYPIQNNVLDRIREQTEQTRRSANFSDFQNILNAEVLDLQDQENRFLKQEADTNLLQELGRTKQLDELLPFAKKARELEELQRYVKDILHPPDAPLTEKEHKQRVDKLHQYLMKHIRRWDLKKKEIGDPFNDNSYRADENVVIFDQLQISLDTYAHNPNILSKTK